MPLPDVADTYKIVLNQSFLGQECLNVFHYRDTALAGLDPVDVAHGFWEHIKVQFRAWMPVSANFLASSVYCEALFGVRAFGEYPIPAGEQQGTRAAATQFMPPTIAASVRLAVGTRTTRPGSKRLVGVLEGDVTVTVIDPAVLAIIQVLADKLETTFDEFGTVNTLTPVIVGYRGGPPPTVSVVQDVTSAVALPDISHQVSRDHRNA